MCLPIGRRVSLTNLPYTIRNTDYMAEFNVTLKEEKTRMRISDEIQKKRANKPVWVALPDRPVTTQRQYCLW